MKYVTILVLGLAACAVPASCTPPAESPQRRPLVEPYNPQAETAEPSPAAPAAADSTMIVQIEQASIEAPVGTVSESDELWNSLDEQRLPSQQAIVLGRNGLRIGVVRQESWPDVAKLLTRLTGRAILRTSAVIAPGSPWPMDVQKDMPAQTIFIRHEDQSVSGMDYPPGDNLMSFVCTADSDDPRRMVLVGVPQIRARQNQTRIVPNSGNFQWVNEPVMYSLLPLTFRLSLNQGEVVIIGPGRQSRKAYSAGHQFMLRNKQGVEVETVLILIPQVVIRNIQGI